MSFPHTLYFIRHGETDWNRAGRLQGHIETGLNATGRAQAARNGQALADLFAHLQVDPASLPFVASPMARVRQTAAIVRDTLGLNGGWATDERLREVGFGAFEGYTPAEIKQRFPDLHSARRDDRWRFRPPHGESYEDLGGRITDWLETVTGDMIVISHGGISRVLRGHVLGLPGKEAVSLDVPQDKVMVIGAGRLDWI